MKLTRTLVLLALGVGLLAAPALAGGLVRNRSTTIVLKDAPLNSTSLESVGDTTVIRSGTTTKGATTAAEILRKALLDAGYKVVNAGQLRTIQRAAAERYKLENNIAGLKSLGAKYGVSQFIVGTVTVHRSGLNDFGLYTGTASLAVNAYTSGGKYLLSETVMAKEVGATDDEAGYKALVSAARQLVERIVDAEGGAPLGDGLRLKVRGVRAYRELQELQNAARSVPDVSRVQIGEYAGGTAEMTVEGSLSAQELARGLEAQLEDWCVLRVVGGTVELEPR